MLATRPLPDGSSFIHHSRDRSLADVSRDAMFHILPASPLYPYWMFSAYKNISFNRAPALYTGSYKTLFTLVVFGNDFLIPWNLAFKTPHISTSQHASVCVSCSETSHITGQFCFQHVVLSKCLPVPLYTSSRVVSTWHGTGDSVPPLPCFQLLTTPSYGVVDADLRTRSE